MLQLLLLMLLLLLLGPLDPADLCKLRREIRQDASHLGRAYTCFHQIGTQKHSVLYIGRCYVRATVDTTRPLDLACWYSSRVQIYSITWSHWWPW